MQEIHLDLSRKGLVLTLFFKQGDVGRKFIAEITESGAAYDLSGVVFSAWYSGTSGEGNYTDINGKTAFSVSGNKVTVELIAQMLVNRGGGCLCLVMSGTDGKQIGLWNIPYIVEAVPGADSTKATQYYTAFSDAVKNLPYPDTTLSLANRAADAAAVGAALAQKAPAGYGLADVAGNLPVLDDCHNAFTNGWYNVSVNSANGPGDGGVMRVDAYGWQSRTLTYYSTSYTGNGLVVMQKNLFNGVWGEWEWVNPHMVPGVEYRTTERWNGKAVYAVLVNCGAYPESGVLNVKTGFTATAVARFHGAIGYVSLPLAGNMEINTSHENSELVVQLNTTGQRILGGDTYVELYYTKD